MMLPVVSFAEVSSIFHRVEIEQLLVVFESECGEVCAEFAWPESVAVRCRSFVCTNECRKVCAKLACSENNVGLMRSVRCRSGQR